MMIQNGRNDMALDILELRKLCIPKNIRITLHAAKRLEQRGIFLKDVISCIMNGEIIEQYPDDYPYPSCLYQREDLPDFLLPICYLHQIFPASTSPAKRSCSSQIRP